jgi:hypothetical protein
MPPSRRNRSELTRLSILERSHLQTPDGTDTVSGQPWQVWIKRSSLPLNDFSIAVGGESNSEVRDFIKGGRDAYRME